MADLYRVLGVRRSATPDQIKKAYRKKAATYHPDVNPGDAEAAKKYHQVDEAFAVLSDPERRAAYDATGDTTKPKPVSALDFMEVVHGFLMEALQSDYTDPARTDVAAVLRDKVRDATTRGEKHLARLQRTREKFQRFLGRTSSAEGNHLDALVRGELEKIQQAVDATQRELDRLTRAKKYLDTCRYRTDGTPATATCDDVLRMITTTLP